MSCVTLYQTYYVFPKQFLGEIPQNPPDGHAWMSMEYPWFGTLLIYSGVSWGGYPWPHHKGKKAPWPSNGYCWPGWTPTRSSNWSYLGILPDSPRIVRCFPPRVARQFGSRRCPSLNLIERTPNFQELINLQAMHGGKGGIFFNRLKEDDPHCKFF
jgi:hypothetical protein